MGKNRRKKIFEDLEIVHTSPGTALFINTTFPSGANAIDFPLAPASTIY